jgi:hypothetical protein
LHRLAASGPTATCARASKIPLNGRTLALRHAWPAAPAELHTSNGAGARFCRGSSRLSGVASESGIDAREAGALPSTGIERAGGSTFPTAARLVAAITRTHAPIHRRDLGMSASVTPVRAGALRTFDACLLPVP